MGLCLGSYGGSRGGTISYEPGTPEREPDDLADEAQFKNLI